MESDAEDRNTRMEIEKTLSLVSVTIVEINRELKAIKNLVNSNGEMNRSMMNTIERLSEEAESLGFDVNSLSDVDQGLLPISTEPIDAVEKLLSGSMNQ